MDPTTILAWRMLQKALTVGPRNSRFFHRFMKASEDNRRKVKQSERPEFCAKGQGDGALSFPSFCSVPSLVTFLMCYSSGKSLNFKSELES